VKSCTNRWRVVPKKRRAPKERVMNKKEERIVNIESRKRERRRERRGEKIGGAHGQGAKNKRSQPNGGRRVGLKKKGERN